MSNQTDKPTRKRKANVTLWKRNERHGLPRLNRPYPKEENCPEDEDPFELFVCPCPGKGSCFVQLGGSQEIDIIRKSYDQIRKNADIRSLKKDIHYHENLHLSRYCELLSSNGRSKYRYFLPDSDGKNQTICQKAFCVAFGISDKRLKTIRDLDTGQVNPKQIDTGRKSSANKISESVRDFVRKHIAYFPARESHYSRAKPFDCHYLDSNLDVKKMWRLLKSGNPENSIIQSITYSLYLSVFNYEFKLKFGYPRSDICDTCELYRTRVKTAEYSSFYVRVSREFCWKGTE